jgi:hypothetical protein
MSRNPTETLRLSLSAVTLVLASLALNVVLVPEVANAATPTNYPLGSAPACLAHYVETTLTHTVNGKKVKYTACVYIAPKKISTSTSTTTAPKKPASPTLTQQQQSAVEEAKQYLSTEAFSRQGLIDQLDSPDGSGYSVNDATVAVDSLTVNWNTEAVQAAKEYLATEPFSCNNLIAQLDSPDGSEFTVAQATYGAQHAGDC